MLDRVIKLIVTLISYLTGSRQGQVSDLPSLEEGPAVAEQTHPMNQAASAQSQAVRMQNQAISVYASASLGQTAAQRSSALGQAASAQSQGLQGWASVDPDPAGDFLIMDVYPPDLDDPHTPQIDLPPFRNIVGATVQGKHIIGCYVKCSEGLGWGAKNEDWFRRCWRDMLAAGGDRYGRDWFRGCYHFLRFDTDGSKQADYCLSLIDSAGGFNTKGDLMLWLDVEEGGQGSWAGGERLESIKDPAKRTRLAGEVRACASAFVARAKAKHPGMRVGIYGRGVFRDLVMPDARFGADAACNPAYTSTMPRMEQYGWPLSDVIEWQLCGDGYVTAHGFPSNIPGWGKTDYSVCIDGSNPVRLSSVRRRCLGWKP